MQYISEQQLQHPGLHDLLISYVDKKECGEIGEKRLCLAGDHPLGIIPHGLPIQKALNRVGRGEWETIPDHRPSSSRGGGREVR